jgi:hypothetical protein
LSGDIVSVGPNVAELEPQYLAGIDKATSGLSTPEVDLRGFDPRPKNAEEFPGIP